MEDNSKMIESVMERITDYGKTSLELVKLKTSDKTSDLLSSLLSYSIVLALISSFMVLVSLGVSIWLGELLGKIYFGFFVLAAVYGITTIIILLFFQKKIKQSFQDWTIKEMLK